MTSVLLIPSPVAAIHVLRVLGDRRSCCPVGVGLRTGRVYRLDLAGAGLREEIPGEIAGLTALGHLDLANNRLTGRYPPELWGLSNLTGIKLNDNELTGEVPAGIANLPNLDVLNLRGDELTGCVPSMMRDHLDRDSRGYGLEFCN